MRAFYYLCFRIHHHSIQLLVSLNPEGLLFTMIENFHHHPHPHPTLISFRLNNVIVYLSGYGVLCSLSPRVETPESVCAHLGRFPCLLRFINYSDPKLYAPR